MTEMPSCETCANYNGGEYFDKCKNEIFPDNMDSTERQYIKDWIKTHGCLSHPQAREYLMEPVLEELERRRKGNPTSAYVEGMFDGYDEAFDLIRNGVEK